MENSKSEIRNRIEISIAIPLSSRTGSFLSTWHPTPRYFNTTNLAIVSVRTYLPFFSFGC